MRHGEAKSEIRVSVTVTYELYRSTFGAPLTLPSPHFASATRGEGEIQRRTLNDDWIPDVARG